MTQLGWNELATPYTLGLACIHGYKPARHLKAIDDVVMDAFSGRGPRVVVVDAPPRHGKSYHISFATPLWALMHAPNTKIIHTSYQEQVSKHFGGLVLDAYKEIGEEHTGFRVSRRKNSAGLWETQAGGGMICVGRGGALTSRGSHLLIIDDILKDSQEALSKTIRETVVNWFDSTASTRMEKDSVCLITATRWYRNDLSGHVLAAALKEGGMPVAHLSLPAIAGKADPIGRKPGEALWPEQWPIERLLQKKASMTGYWWRALYQQDTNNPEGSTFDTEWFDDIYADEWPDRSVFKESCLAMDPAEGADKGDYQGLVWAGFYKGHIYIDCDLEKRPIDACCDRLVQMWKQNGGSGTLLESNSFQRLIGEELDAACDRQGMPPMRIFEVRSQTKKELRIQRLAPDLRKGLFKFRRPKEEGSGCDRLRDQLMDYPNGDHDDGPDALEMAVRMLNHLLSGDSVQDRQTVLNPR